MKYNVILNADKDFQNCGIIIVNSQHIFSLVCSSQQYT